MTEAKKRSDTTLSLKKETLDRLRNKFPVKIGETWDDVINGIVDELEACRKKK